MPSSKNPTLVKKVAPGLALVAPQRPLMIDTGAPPSIEQYVQGLVTEGCSILVDMRKASNIDLTGLGSLVAAYKIAKREGQGFAFCRTNSKVRQAFELNKLDDKFLNYKSIEAGVEAYQQGQFSHAA